MMLSAQSFRLERLTSQLPSESAIDVLRFSLWLGILSGMTEACIALTKGSFRHLPLADLMNAQVIWTAPLAGSVSLLVLASVLLVITLPLPNRSRWRGLIAPSLVFVCTYFALRFLRVGIAPPAAAVLAFGVAAVVLRLRRSRPAGTSRIVRRSLPILAGALIAYALLISPWRQWREARLLRDLPPVSAGRPNVLVIIWDTVRAFELSLYGYSRETTPELSRFASTGTTFNRAFSTAPWTLPSHASIFTGRYPFELSAGWDSPYDGAYPTVATAFTRDGYAAGAFVANRYYLTPAWGLARGFTTFDYSADLDFATVMTTWSLSREVQRFVLRQFGNHAEMQRRSARHVNNAFLAWLTRVKGRPFFGVLNHIDAHEPYYPPAPYRLAYARPPYRYWAKGDFEELSPEIIAQLRDAYDGGVKYLDSELGQLLRELKSRGVLDNTIVVVTSDHGEELGAHANSVVLHGNTLFTTSTLVPLVVVYPPRIRANYRADYNVSTRDIPATVMDLAGVRDRIGILGESIVRTDANPVSPPVDRPILSMTEKLPDAKTASPDWSAAQGPLFSVALGDLHYIRDAKGGEHVYNLSRDIWEKTDLAATPEGSAALERFRKILDSAIVQPAGALRARARKNVK